MDTIFEHTDVNLFHHCRKFSAGFGPQDTPLPPQGAGEDDTGMDRFSPEKRHWQPINNLCVHEG